jgi:hypothetical protein
MIVRFTAWETRQWEGTADLDLPDDAEDAEVREALNNLLMSSDLTDITDRDEQQDVELRDWERAYPLSERRHRDGLRPSLRSALRAREALRRLDGGRPGGARRHPHQRLGLPARPGGDPGWRGRLDRSALRGSYPEAGAEDQSSTRRPSSARSARSGLGFRRRRDVAKEYAVYDKRERRFAGPGQRWPSLAGAQLYLGWLEETRELLRTEAEAEERSRFADGNVISRVYHDQWERAEWAVLQREVSAWEPVSAER